jgi:uncharacterized protein (DUF983 family)
MIKLTFPGDNVYHAPIGRELNLGMEEILIQPEILQDQKKVLKPGYLWSLIHHKCPRCRKGNMFLEQNPYKLKGFMKMYERCPSCEQFLEIEKGFYYGTSYISYALTIALSATTCVAWWLTIGFSQTDNRFVWWLGTNTLVLILSQPYLMRFSRSFWLSFFVGYNPNWRVEKPVPPERN